MNGSKSFFSFLQSAPTNDNSSIHALQSKKEKISAFYNGAFRWNIMGSYLFWFSKKFHFWEIFKIVLVRKPERKLNHSLF